MKYIFTFKNSISCLASVIVLMSAVLTTGCDISHKYIYQFDCQTFKSKQDLDQYVNDNIIL